MIQSSMMAVNHWPNQSVLAGASEGPMMFSLVFGMTWCVHSHWAKRANDGTMKKARLNFIGPMRFR